MSPAPGVYLLSEPAVLARPWVKPWREAMCWAQRRKPSGPRDSPWLCECQAVCEEVPGPATCCTACVLSVLTPGFGGESQSLTGWPVPTQQRARLKRVAFLVHPHSEKPRGRGPRGKRFPRQLRWSGCPAPFPFLGGLFVLGTCGRFYTVSKKTLNDRDVREKFQF